MSPTRSTLSKVRRPVGPDAKVHTAEAPGRSAYAISVSKLDGPTPDQRRYREEQVLSDSSDKEDEVDEVDEEDIQLRVARIHKRVEELTGTAHPMPQKTLNDAQRIISKKTDNHSRWEEIRQQAVLRSKGLSEIKDDTPGNSQGSSTHDSYSSVLSINSGDDLEPETKDILPYKLIKVLGVGGSASVEMVSDTKTGSIYARKTFKNIYSRNIKDAKQKFRNEVKVMRRLASHHHIIKVHATYIVKRELALILSPVADSGDLAVFLQEYRDADMHGPAQTQILHRAFGCLASGLKFIHQQQIRHKDIKPQNVLIHQGLVLYTDFGIALDFLETARSTTFEALQGLTRKYCAPEVAYQTRRNTKSDIFSLGCVYLEILEALFPELLPEALFEGCFFEKATESSILHSLELPGYTKFSFFRKMLSVRSEDRPTAVEVVHELYTNSSFYFCNECAKEFINDYDTAPLSAIATVSEEEKRSAQNDNVVVTDLENSSPEIPPPPNERDGEVTSEPGEEGRPASPQMTFRTFKLPSIYSPKEGEVEEKKKKKNRKKRGRKKKKSSDIKVFSESGQEDRPASPQETRTLDFFRRDTFPDGPKEEDFAPSPMEFPPSSSPDFHSSDQKPEPLALQLTPNPDWNSWSDGLVSTRTPALMTPAIQSSSMSRQRSFNPQSFTEDLPMLRVPSDSSAFMLPLPEDDFISFGSSAW